MPSFRLWRGLLASRALECFTLLYRLSPNPLALMYHTMDVPFLPESLGALRGRVSPLSSSVAVLAINSPFLHVSHYFLRFP